MRMAFTIVLLSLGCLTLPVVAQEAPDAFYQDNYAETPLSKDKKVTTAGGKTKTGESQLRGTRGDRVSPRTEREPLIAKGVESSSLSGLEVQPVLALGAIINAFDEEHYVLYANKLMELLLDRDLNAGSVYLHNKVARGNELELRYSLMAALPILGGRLQSVQEIPEKYSKVTVSPTWIIRTEKGEYLLEGIETPERFITADGGFVEKPVAAPALEEARPTPLPAKSEEF